MRRALIVLLFGFALAPFIVRAESLASQLEAAQKDQDLHAEIEITRRILDQEPTNAGLKESLIRLWLRAGDFDLAEQTLLLWPEAPASLKATTTAAVLWQRENQNAAREVLAKYLANHPQDLEATSQLASFYQNDPGKVRALLTESPLTGESQLLLLQRAAAEKLLGDYPAALADFDRAKSLDSEAPAIRDVRPSFERLAAALPSLQAAEAALHKDPRDFRALLQRAYFSLSADLAREQVHADAETARQINPDSTAVLLLLAKTSSQPSTHIITEYGVDPAIALPEPGQFEKLITLDTEVHSRPTATSSRLARASLLGEAPPQYRLALRDAGTVLEKDPSNSEAGLAAVYAASRLNDLPTAREWLARLSASRPPAKLLAQARFYLSEAELAGDNLDAALQLINEAVKADTKASYLKQRAAILIRLNRQAEAEADLAKASALEKRSKR